MKLLFKREQAVGTVTHITFKLWGKLELDEEEQALTKRYGFAEALLIEAYQPNLFRTSLAVGVVACLIAFFLAHWLLDALTLPLSLAAAIVVGYWYYHNHRETIFVRDLLHGRHFRCKSVIDLARKEAWLGTVAAFLRQVMESAKHWDGTETHTIEALPKDEARQFILKGL